MAINHQLKEKNIQIQSALDEMKKKNILLKEGLSQKAEIEQQLQFIKTSAVDFQMRADKLEDEKKKLIEISIEDKLSMEEKINKLLFKANSD